MRIERELPVLRGLFAQLPEIPSGGGADATPPVRVRVEQIGAGLEGRESPLVMEPARAFGCLGPVSPLDRVVHADAVARGAAEQAVHGQPGILAGDVPERLIEGGDRRQADSPGREPELLVDLHHQVLDAARVLAPDQREQVVGDRRHAQVGSGGVRLAPAVDALVGLHLHERARARLQGRHVGGDTGDLHRCLSSDSIVGAPRHGKRAVARAVVVTPACGIDSRGGDSAPARTRAAQRAHCRPRAVVGGRADHHLFLRAAV